MNSNSTGVTDYQLLDQDKSLCDFHSVHTLTPCITNDEKYSTVDCANFSKENFHLAELVFTQSSLKNKDDCKFKIKLHQNGTLTRSSTDTILADMNAVIKHGMKKTNKMKTPYMVEVIKLAEQFMIDSDCTKSISKRGSFLQYSSAQMTNIQPTGRYKDTKSISTGEYISTEVKTKIAEENATVFKFRDVQGNDYAFIVIGNCIITTALDGNTANVFSSSELQNKSDKDFLMTSRIEALEKINRENMAEKADMKAQIESLFAMVSALKIVPVIEVIEETPVIEAVTEDFANDFGDVFGIFEADTSDNLFDDITISTDSEDAITNHNDGEITDTDIEGNNNEIKQKMAICQGEESQIERADEEMSGITGDEMLNKYHLELPEYWHYDETTFTYHDERMGKQFTFDGLRNSREFLNYKSNKIHFMVYVREVFGVLEHENKSTTESNDVVAPSTLFPDTVEEKPKFKFSSLHHINGYTWESGRMHIRGEEITDFKLMLHREFLMISDYTAELKMISNAQLLLDSGAITDPDMIAHITEQIS